MFFINGTQYLFEINVIQVAVFRDPDFQGDYLIPDEAEIKCRFLEIRQADNILQMFICQHDTKKMSLVGQGKGYSLTAIPVLAVAHPE